VSDIIVFPKTKIQIVLQNGGMGDMVYWIVALQYLFRTTPNIHGTVIVPQLFFDLAKLWLKDFSKFRVSLVAYPEGVPTLESNTREEFMLMTSEPEPNQKTVVIQKSTHLAFPNLMGFHPMDVGFMNLVNDEVPESERRMPKITGDEADIAKFNLPEKYVVISASAEAKSRTMAPSTLYDLASYCINNGYTPVYLGKRMISGDSHEPVQAGRDLREQTTLLEAACIMAKAKCVVGMDGGLMHLAACSGVPIVMGMTIVSEKKRTPYSTGPMRFVAVKGLDCLYCQDRYKYFMGHDFNTCVFDHYKCCTDLTADIFIKELKEFL
jgi:ADP-heptose:LPS heptosyltransferase